MSGDTPEHSLDCPGCGSEVFTRDIAVWHTDEEEHCPGCGGRVMVALDEDDADPDLLTARVYVYEHGGEVVARLRAEVEYLQTRPAEGVSEHVRTRVAEAGQEALAGKAGCLRKSCLAPHQVCEILDAYDDSAAEVERLAAEREDIELEHAQEVAGLRSNAAAVKIQRDNRAARLRERATSAESPERATAIIAAWLKLLGPMRESDGFAYTIGENLTAPEVRSGLGDDGWRFLAGDRNTVDVGDLDLSDIHSGAPTGASPPEPMTGPEFIEFIEDAIARGDLTEDGIGRLRRSVTPGGEQP